MTGLTMAERLLRRDRLILLGLIGLLFMLAGLYTVLGIGMEMGALDMTANRGLSDMPGQGTPGNWEVGYAILVFLMWWVMMVAMMLPSVTPTLLLYAAMLRHGAAADRVPAITLGFAGGYLAAWAGFSALATLIQWGLEVQGVFSAGMMTLTGSVPGALVLIATGLFQFTPLKRACLSHCRSPAEFIVARRRPGVAGGFAMGTEHGVYCVGCCWSLMALLFVGGIMNLYWIVGIAAYVAGEKLTRWGRPLSLAAGAALTGWGVAIVAGMAG